MAERRKIICPNCDAVVAIVPESGLDDTNLRCSNCGTALRGSGPLERAADKAKDVVKDVEKKIEKKARSE